MTLYGFSPINAYSTNTTQEVADGAGIPTFWTDVLVPTIPDGMFARWNYPDWVITDVEPPVPSVIVEPVIQVAQVSPNVIA
jgi:hypothetical protein